MKKDNIFWVSTVGRPCQAIMRWAFPLRVWVTHWWQRWEGCTYDDPFRLGNVKHTLCVCACVYVWFFDYVFLKSNRKSDFIFVKKSLHASFVFIFDCVYFLNLRMKTFFRALVYFEILSSFPSVTYRLSDKWKGNVQNAHSLFIFCSVFCSGNVCKLADFQIYSYLYSGGFYGGVCLYIIHGHLYNILFLNKEKMCLFLRLLTVISDFLAWLKFPV